MLRRHRCAVALVCLAALVVALGVGASVLPACEPAAAIASVGACVRTGTVPADRARPAALEAVRRAAPPRAPPAR